MVERGVSGSRRRNAGFRGGVAGAAAGGRDTHMATGEGAEGRLGMPDLRLVSGAPARSDRAPEAATLLDLALRAQASQDPADVFAELFREARRHCAVAGLRMACAGTRKVFSAGDRAPHTAGYRLVFEREALGELEASRRDPFAEDDLVRLEALLRVVLPALRNALRFDDLRRAALRDPLTGVGNRAALETTLAREVALAERHGQPLGVVMIDVDRFKKLNDEHGHPYGDRVLQRLAATLGSALRRTDAVFRYGGEEFFLVLPRATAAQAAAIGERIRTLVAATPVDAPAELRPGLAVPRTVTVSVGVTAFRPGDSPESLVQRTDQALYDAKRSGRNTVCQKL